VGTKGRQEKRIIQICNLNSTVELLKPTNCHRHENHICRGTHDFGNVLVNVTKLGEAEGSKSNFFVGLPILALIKTNVLVFAFFNCDAAATIIL